MTNNPAEVARSGKAVSIHERRFLHEALCNRRSQGLDLWGALLLVCASVRMCVCVSVCLCASARAPVRL